MDKIEKKDTPKKPSDSFDFEKLGLPIILPKEIPNNSPKSKK
tara:strand:+ start:2239 stop:2364 length:126 start_codon:yes stop_codon:yes gene_type:complete